MIDRVRLELVSDLHIDGEPAVFTRGSELLVDTTTAAALILSGAAIKLPPRDDSDSRGITIES